MPLELSTPGREGVLEVSKSRKLPILVSASEMENLVEELEEFVLLDVSRPLPLEEAEISKEQFLSTYREYVEGIQASQLVDERPLRPFFSALWTKALEMAYAQELPNGKVLVKARVPAIQLQRHHFIYSDNFHSGVMGPESVSWGIQFSYPNLYLDPKTRAIGKVDWSDRFPNTALFQKLAKWVRDYTRATPFVVEGKKINQPMRLGKECISWINNHPDLKKRGLYVDAENHS